MQGYLYKKSRSWTDYFYLWRSSWKRKFVILTNLGLLIFDESNLQKPKKFVSTVMMRIDDKVTYNEFRRDFVFKLVDYDLNEIVYAADNEEEFKQWVKTIKKLQSENKERTGI